MPMLPNLESARAALQSLAENLAVAAATVGLPLRSRVNLPEGAQAYAGGKQLRPGQFAPRDYSVFANVDISELLGEEPGTTFEYARVNVVKGTSAGEIEAMLKQVAEDKFFDNELTGPFRYAETLGEA
jgi:hypothetical protein